MDHIVIVGGGTAGWMSAIALSSHFPRTRITVVDPSDIGPLGVGESVTGVVQQFVQYPFHGLDMSEFYRNSDATLKLGVWYHDWQGPGTEYLTPIDPVPDLFRHHYFEDLEAFYALATCRGHAISEWQIHGGLMRAGKTDLYRRTDGTIATDLSTGSCQFDALKFAAWLRTKAAQRENIAHVDDQMTRFDQDAETGFVSAIHTRRGTEIRGDFFLDCTGFRGLLFQDAFRPEWIDYSRHVKVDRAIPLETPYPSGQAIPVYTAAKAMKHGWMWQLPTQSRLGMGYVYSSRYVDDDEAVSELREVVEGVPEQPRIIRFRPGKRKTQWEANVCAIGLSGGFLEPLEASTIHMMYGQIKALTELFLPYFRPEAASALSAGYNTMIDAMYEDVVDFVTFHYHAGRRDTEFWRDYQKPESMTPRNRSRMEKWEHAFPCREDFAGVTTQRFALTTGLLIWMPMLCGMKLLRRHSAEALVGGSKFMHLARENLEHYERIRDFLCQHAISQREAVAFLRGERPATHDGGDPWTIYAG